MERDPNMPVDSENRRIKAIPSAERVTVEGSFPSSEDGDSYRHKNIENSYKWMDNYLQALIDLYKAKYTDSRNTESVNEAFNRIVEYLKQLPEDRDAQIKGLFNKEGSVDVGRMKVDEFERMFDTLVSQSFNLYYGSALKESVEGADSKDVQDLNKAIREKMDELERLRKDVYYSKTKEGKRDVRINNIRNKILKSRHPFLDEAAKSIALDMGDLRLNRERFIKVLLDNYSKKKGIFRKLKGWLNMRGVKEELENTKAVFGYERSIRLRIMDLKRNGGNIKEFVIKEKNKLSEYAGQLVPHDKGDVLDKIIRQGYYIIDNVCGEEFNK